MDVFCCERELCELFKSNNKNFTITFDISSEHVNIYVRHFGDWDSQKGKVILNKLWKNFKLPLIGSEDTCKLQNYTGFITDDIVSEYMFTMQNVDFLNTQNYNNKYVLILTEQS